MTPNEFSDAVEEAIEDQNLPIYKIIDLRELAKFAKRRGRVNRIDEVVLKWAGAPMGSPVTWIKAPVKPKQVSLF